MIGNIVKVALSKPILLMVAKVYIPVLFPLTFLIGLVALKLDALLGFESGFVPSPANYGLAVGVFLFGVALWIVTYEQLVHRGEGSPSPTAGRTQKLVVNGVYAYARNPSIWGKLVGVEAVGIAINSISFCLILIPILLAISLVEKVVRQEPQLVDIFGEDYERYRKQVPLVVPWGLLFKSRRYQEKG